MTLKRCEVEDCGATLASDGHCHICDAGEAARRDPALAWRLFVASRPKAVQDAVAQYNLKPNAFYTLGNSTPDGVLYRLIAISDDGSHVRMLRSGGLVPFSYEVFGIPVEDLVLHHEMPIELLGKADA